MPDAYARCRFYSPASRMTRSGLPPTKVPGATSRCTTEPAATTANRYLLSKGDTGQKAPEKQTPFHRTTPVTQAVPILTVSALGQFIQLVLHFRQLFVHRRHVVALLLGKFA